MLTCPSEPSRWQDLLVAATRDLQGVGIENPRLEAEVLLAEALQTSRATVLANSQRAIDSVAHARFAAMLSRRTAREPLAYIAGHKEFFSLDLEVTPEVLIPRPETETLVAAALEWLSSYPASRVLDIGTGSGTIALALAANAPSAIVTAADISAAALEVARRNAARLLEGRILFCQANCFEVMDGGEDLGSFALIVSNPPYIPDAEIAELQPEIADWEPRLALGGGPDGLYFYRRIAQGLRAHLAPGGALILEAGDNQANAIASILSAAGLTRIELVRDLAGIARVIRAAY
jgi:release factor glutamine methyltransferase